MPDKLRPALEARAKALGFDAVRIAPADIGETPGEHLADFVAAGHHGTMDWMAMTLDRRRSPRALWPEARSVVVLGLNYGPERDPREILEKPDRGAIAAYAGNRDYHDIVKGRLKQLAGWLASRADCDVKVFVDTAPVMEKPIAAHAGLGWQGKHTNLVSRDYGSWLFLGEIYTTLDLAPDPPLADHCGSCRACLDACPTGALPEPYRIDARLCISYLTIEMKGPIPRHLRPAIGNRIYGCDDCLAVCPWNKYASATREMKLAVRDDLEAPRLADLAALDDAAFRAFFSGSPAKRIGRDRFVRNVLIAIGNSGDTALLQSVRPLLADESPLVRGAAAWAFRRLAAPGAIETTRTQRLALETDTDVRAEWAAEKERERKEETGQ
ncbi:epoxyqueuosine reductase [Rhodobium orientis]|uniref:Epoxyqueuosine reductase n=1 Tax=Rhodobium orientis TaxID=34017 RepID=A0A327JSF3_9HYPH|nr:tRNA epoxyqueuosine(34) reductase QueG [Rhodobium orientis]MBB4303449.1 epoxyqueuosine reductase [Rhodobium orientis]MBK5950383.1 tRNA epoxyqueuosine(34) reductase QueG [Rhodobium orientis]RAI28384.1 tRNA epoxyqueuosine(34) reductase QueG [Rhodobium orientis]